MSNDNDDKPTVVLDLNALKKELAEKQKVDEEVTQDIEFAVHDQVGASQDKSNNSSLVIDEDLGDDLVDLTEEGSILKLVFFDFHSQYFSKLVPKLPSDFADYVIISELKELNDILQSKEPVTVLFNYNAAPKAVNQLTAQIKAKFPDAKTVIIAKGLSPEKASQHQKSKSGANTYLSVPFSIDKFKEEILKI